VFEVSCSYLGGSLPSTLLQVAIGGVTLASVTGAGTYSGKFTAVSDEELTIQGNMTWLSLTKVSVRHIITEGN
jgi:hypothetical protein